MAGENYPPRVNSGEGEDWKKRLKALGIARKRGKKKEEYLLRKEEGGGPAAASGPPGSAAPRSSSFKEISLRTSQKVRSGREGEAIASLLLEENSLIILARNVRYPDGEIDIIALDGATTVFVEVKRRRNASRGAAAEAVTSRKRERILRAARKWLAQGAGRAPSSRGVRFDVVAIHDDPPSIEWIRGAFDATR